MHKTRISICLICLCLIGFLHLSAQNIEHPFYQIDSIQSIHIQFSQDNYLERLDSLAVNGDEYLIATVHVNGQKFPFSGVRLARSMPNVARSNKSALEIKLNYINKSQSYLGIRDISLSQALRDPSLVREVLYFEMARKYMLAPMANYARVMLGDQNYGLMVNVETVNLDFIERRSLPRDGSLIGAHVRNKHQSKEGSKECKNGLYGELNNEVNPVCFFNDYQLLTEGGWDDLLALTDALNTHTEKGGNINEVLYVDQALMYLALNAVTVNLKSYLGKESGTYYLYKSAHSGFVLIPWGGNLAFGSYKNTGIGSDLSIKDLETFDPRYYITQGRKPLFASLMDEPNNKKKYDAFVQTFNEQFIENNWVFDRIDSLKNLIQEDRREDELNYYSYEQFLASDTMVIGKLSKIPPLKSFLMKRKDYFKFSEYNTTKASEVLDIEFKQREEFSSNRLSDFTITVRTDNYAKKVTVYYKMANDSKYSEFKLTPDKKSGSSDQKFSGTIPKHDATSMSYYIMTENAKKVKFFPENYMMKDYEISIDELN